MKDMVGYIDAIGSRSIILETPEGGHYIRVLDPTEFDRGTERRLGTLMYAKFGRVATRYGFTFIEEAKVFNDIVANTDLGIDTAESLLRSIDVNMLKCIIAIGCEESLLDRGGDKIVVQELFMNLSEFYPEFKTEAMNRTIGVIRDVKDLGLSPKQIALGLKTITDGSKDTKALTSELLRNIALI